jgi:hypothetical protein
MGQYFGEEKNLMDPDGPDYKLPTFYIGHPVQRSDVFDFSDTPAIVAASPQSGAESPKSPAAALPPGSKKSPVLALALAAGGIYLLSRG